MMRRTFKSICLAGCLLPTFFSIACSDPDGATDDSASGGSSGASGTGGDSTGGSGTGGGDSDWPNEPLGFNPSNVNLDGNEEARVGDLVVSGDCELLSETGEITCADPSSYKHEFVRDYSVFVVKSLTVEAEAQLKTAEGRPVILIALDDMTVSGTIRAVPGTAGGGSLNETLIMGENRVSDGGGSFCGYGGLGAAVPGAAAGLSPDPYGFEELSPLVGGTAGGFTDESAGAGLGGGAIQLVAGGTFEVTPSGIVNAGGGGGLSGASMQPAGGGGSGGAILIEASNVVLAGALTANGGGGGQGEGADGEDGRPDATPAAGGDMAPPVGRGGDGSAAEQLNGADGTIDTDSYPGGGGGGAGRIRINTPTGQVDFSQAVVSPSPMTECTTIGVL